MVNRVKSGTVIGLNAYEVWVETDVINSLPAFSIVGLPDTAVNEARDRVKSAIKNSGYTFPSRKVIINLAPADLKKNGAGFDLPIAIGVLIEEEVLTSQQVEDYAFVGELALDGLIRPVNGVLSLALGLKEAGIKNLIVPEENVQEAGLIDGINIFGASHLVDVISHFTENKLTQIKVDPKKFLNKQFDYSYDFKDVKGHSENPLMTQRPFRSIHHTASANGIIGGGSNPKPGEITLAHRGVLFLDEMVEFPRNVLEVLRQPLEDGEIVISRTAHSIKYPAEFILLGAMNPCPCGFLGDKEKHCTCSDFQINRYLSKLSGPLLDRIDLQIDVPRLTPEELLNTNGESESSEQIRKRVIKARQIQSERYKNENIKTNSELTSKLIKKYCKISQELEVILKSAAIKYQLSGRRYDRILKLARTIADLAESKNIEQIHLMQALQYRMFKLEDYGK